MSICAIARRIKNKSAICRRYWTLLPPGSNIEYTVYADSYHGTWQNGLRMMFQQRYLYDLKEFDDHLFQRKDLQWIRHKYIVTHQFAWDHEFYDFKKGEFQVEKFLTKGKRLFGGYDVFGIWPTWPRLGVDQRNQWDLYRDIPGGLEQLREVSNYAHQQGTKFFIAYNPWDKSTRPEDPYQGMARIIKAINADGVVLDCHGSSSKKLQAAADGVKPGVIMYSEGMAVPKDMPGIVAGRVHDAIYMPPPINLNKFIKPDFAIFRVCQLSDSHLEREISISFFNGIGTELHMFRPGRRSSLNEEYRYLGQTTMILRENSSAFLSKDWTLLIPTLQDSIWVNKWQTPNKTIYTIFSLMPAGYKGSLFEVESTMNTHLVDLWHHTEIVPDTIDNRLYLPVAVDAFNQSWLGTRQEGNVDCIAELPNILNVQLHGDSLQIQSNQGTKIVVWAGMPSYQNEAKEFSIGSQILILKEVFGRYQGKFVIQLFEETELLDERIVVIEPGTPRLISQVQRTPSASSVPSGMVEIPSGKLTVKLSSNDQFIPYPDFAEPKTFCINKFYIDKYPVTNLQFKQFLDAANYVPEDSVHFLRHWLNGKIPEGKENYPVIYVSLQDAKAYAEWSGKRLPTEMEWQYAAQGIESRQWPWGAEFDSTRCNVGLNKLTPVDAYPTGASPFEVMDLVGNIWQLTNDVYDNDSHYFVVIRGGSYYHPTSSWWYVKGGPQPLDKHQMLLLVAPGFDRNATVGFRCVKDVE